MATDLHGTSDSGASAAETTDAFRTLGAARSGQVVRGLAYAGTGLPPASSISHLEPPVKYPQDHSPGNDVNGYMRGRQGAMVCRVGSCLNIMFPENRKTDRNPGIPYGDSGGGVGNMGA